MFLFFSDLLVLIAVWGPRDSKMSKTQPYGEVVYIKKLAKTTIYYTNIKNVLSVRDFLQLHSL